MTVGGMKQGQLLMKLWNDDQRAQNTLAKTQVVAARQRSTEACAQAANAAREAERQTALRERGFVSTSREDSARTDAEARRAACAARSTLTTAACAHASIRCPPCA